MSFKEDLPKNLIIMTICVAVVVTIFFFIYENGIYGDWFQAWIAVILCLIGAYDLLKCKGVERLRGTVVFTCSVLLLIPAFLELIDLTK